MLAEPASGGDIFRHALVLSGGGARGAYEIGVLKALFEGTASTTRNRPLNARIFTGTSVGAYNAAFLAQQEKPGADAMARLEAIWRGRIADTPASCGNGVYRLRADPLQFLDLGCLANPLQLLGNLGRDLLFWSGYAAAYGGQFLASDAQCQVRILESFNLTALFSREPLERLLAETIDVSRLAASPNRLNVVVSDWINGTAKVFDKADVVRLGTGALLASASIPGVFPPVPLEGTLFVDGGVLMNTPLKPAIDEGADVLHVVFVDPETSHIPLPLQEGVLPNTADMLYRFYTIVLAAQLNQDIRYAATINEEIAALATGAAAAGGELPAVRARRAREPRRAVAARPQEDKRYRPLVVHSYRPRRELGGIQAFLDFELPAIQTLIQDGYHDAVNHDCIVEGCVLPPEVPPVTPLGRGA